MLNNFASTVQNFGNRGVIVKFLVLKTTICSIAILA